VKLPHSAEMKRLSTTKLARVIQNLQAMRYVYSRSEVSLSFHAALLANFTTSEIHAYV
jgi:hypothetical protein